MSSCKKGKRKEILPLSAGREGEDERPDEEHVTHELTLPLTITASFYSPHSSIPFPPCFIFSNNAILRRIFCRSGAQPCCTPLPLSLMISRVDPLTSDFGQQVQRKVVVCGDGACGALRLHTFAGTSPTKLQIPNRQNLAAERLHERFLHPSIVRPRSRPHQLEPLDPDHGPNPTSVTALANQQYSRTTCTISMSTIKWWNSVCGIPPVCGIHTHRASLRHARLTFPGFHQ